MKQIKDIRCWPHGSLQSALDQAHASASDQSDGDQDEVLDQQDGAHDKGVTTSSNISINNSDQDEEQRRDVSTLVSLVHRRRTPLPAVVLHAVQHLQALTGAVLQPISRGHCIAGG